MLQYCKTHYAASIAARNGLDLNAVILEKDKTASVKYHHTTNPEQFVLRKRGDARPYLAHPRAKR